MNTQYIETLLDEYITHHTIQQDRDFLIQENNIEKRDVKGYHGREILELLQNADDAYQKSLDNNELPQSELNVDICYDNNILTVANTGTFFDKDGIKAIVQGNNSPKKGEYIGNKGTGFRSILNWADSVSIYSGEFAVQFSKEIANNLFDQIKEEEQIKKQLKQHPSLYIPMLAVPKNIIHDRPKDCTTIEIAINEEKIKDDYSVEKQLRGIDLRILLFLPNLSKISIKIGDNRITYERVIFEQHQDLPYKIVELRKIQNEQLIHSEQFHLYAKEIPQAIEEDDTPKDIRLAIAVPVGDVTVEHIYSYFPLLDTISPFNCVLHATYALGDQRNNLSSSEINKSIVREQIKFLIDIAQIYIDKGELATAYRILLPISYSKTSFLSLALLSKFDLGKEFIDRLYNLKMFETVTNEIVSLSSRPKIIGCTFPEVLKGGVFNSLLKYSDDVNQHNLISLISSFLSIDLSISPSELCDNINKCSDTWTVAQQVEVFKWWNDNYRRDNILPNLLKTDDGNWLRCHGEYYFLEGDFEGVELPSWVEVPAISGVYQEELIKYANIDTIENDNKQPAIRYICQNKTYPLIDFKYRDRNNIINAVNGSIKEDYNHSVEFVKWLWKYYGDKETLEQSTHSTTLSFPNSKGSITICNRLYLGAEYGNDIADKIFPADFNSLPGLEVFGINEINKEPFTTFIKHFGVLTFPKIEVQELTPFDIYDKTIKEDIKASGILRFSTENVVACKYRLPYISNLNEVLESVKNGGISMLNIVSWILNDRDLYSILDSEYCSSDAKVLYRTNNQRSTTQTLYTGHIKNYILATFNHVQWIEINSKFYSPMEVLNGFSDNRNHKFERFVPVLTSQIVGEIANSLGCGIDVVAKVFNKFNFAKQVTSLPSESFYGLMLALQDSENLSDQDLSRVIYRIIEQPSFRRVFEDSNNRRRFFEIGKLLVRCHGQLQYHLAKESFLPSQKIINKSVVPIVEKGPRTNNENFVNNFGCKIYNGDYSVIENTAKIASINDDFQKFYTDFIKYARAYSERNDNISRYISQLRITLVNEICIEENNTQTIVTSNYSLIKFSLTNWYIVVHDAQYNKNRVSECIENIFANIANTSGFDVNKIGELFRTSAKEDREFLIKKEFGSLSVIDDKEYYNGVKVNFLETIKKLNSSYMLQDCDINFDQFNSISNSPHIIRLFKELEIDIIDFRAGGFAYSIDVSEYLKSELVRFIRQETDNFMNARYAEAITGGYHLQKCFVETIHQFENYHRVIKITNSVNCDPIGELKKQFGEWQNCEWHDSARNVYNQNYEYLNPNNRFPSDIDSDADAQRMIYFNQKEEFEKWLQQKEAYEKTSQSQDDNEIYSNYKDKMPEEVDIDNVNTSERSSMSECNSNIIPPIGSYNRKKSDIKKSKLKQNGNIGELLIYNALVEKYGEDRVMPHSEAFIDLGILKPGQAYSGDYDISYLGDDDNEIFVEVKTGERNIFYMSPGELKWAKEHSSCYYVYYVYDIHTRPKYIILPQRFWENVDKFQMREIVEKIEFKL